MNLPPIEYPVYIPFLTGRERALVNECFDSTWISSKGAFIEQFESKFADFVGVKNAATVANGTVALHVALDALGIGPGDEVLVPSLTYIASANAVAYTGAKPVFVESEPDYWQIDVEDAERKITDKTKAVMPVHLYGHPCDMNALCAMAKTHNLKIVEDCAEALGSTYDGRHVGFSGNVATFSFFGNKTITTGEGGMVVTNDDALHARIVKLKGQGLSGDREYWHDALGYNYRMTNICAAIGCAQIEGVDDVLRKKAMIAHWYKSELQDLPLSVHGQDQKVQHSYWLVSICTHAPGDRDPLRAHLRQNGIDTRPVFNPLHLMPMYAADNDASAFPIAQSIADRGISLPSYPALEEEDVAIICKQIKDYYSQGA